MNALVNLDHAPFTALLPEAMTAMAEFGLGRGPFSSNPSSPTREGKRAALFLDRVREKVLSCLQLSPKTYQVTFTSSVSEAAALAFKSANPSFVLTSLLEHPSLLKNAAAFPSCRLPLQEGGSLDLDAVEADLGRAPAGSLLTLPVGDYLMGTVPPFETLIPQAKKVGCKVLLDLAQGFGQIPLDFRALDVDFLLMSAAKTGVRGAYGLAALVSRKDHPLEALWRGGSQEKGARPGGQNWMGIVGLDRALDFLSPDAFISVEALKRTLEEEILKRGGRVAGLNMRRLPTITCATRPGLPAQTQMIALDLEGIQVSVGAACQSGTLPAQHPVLVGMRYPSEYAESGLRLSLSQSTTRQEIDTFLSVWDRIFERKEGR